MTCEDYPCCGHTDGLGCDWTYTPEARAFDEAHWNCQHEDGWCEAEEPDYSDDEYAQSLENDSIDGDWYGPDEDAAMEMGLWGSET